MSDQLQIKEDATRKIIVSTAQWIAALLGPDMDGAECIHAIHQFAQGVEDCEPVYPPASPTKRVRAAAVAPGGRILTSGIFVERAAETVDAFTRVGLRLLGQWEEGEWVALEWTHD